VWRWPLGAPIEWHCAAGAAQLQLCQPRWRVTLEVVEQELRVAWAMQDDGHQHCFANRYAWSAAARRLLGGALRRCGDRAVARFLRQLPAAAQPSEPVGPLRVEVRERPCDGGAELRATCGGVQLHSVAYTAAQRRAALQHAQHGYAIQVAEAFERRSIGTHRLLDALPLGFLQRPLVRLIHARNDRTYELTHVPPALLERAWLEFAERQLGHPRER